MIGEGHVFTGEGVHPATTLMRSPDGKCQRGDDGGKDIGSSGKYEETEGGSGKETGHGRWRSDTRCCTQEETVGVTVLISS